MSRSVSQDGSLSARADTVRGQERSQTIASSRSTTASGHVIDLTLARKRVIWTLSLIAVAIVAVHIVITIMRDVLDMDFVGLDNLYTAFGVWAENSVANWYSSTLALVSSALLAVVAVAKRAQRDRYTLHWAGLALLFLALAIDDAADVHGQVSYVLHHVYETDGFLLYAWVLPGIAFAAIVALLYARFLVHLPSSTRWRFLIAGALYSVSALGLELLESRYDSQYGVENLTYKTMVTIEESLEMVALILFIATLLAIIRAIAPTIRIALK